MEVSGQLHGTAIRFPGKEPPVVCINAPVPFPPIDVPANHCYKGIAGNGVFEEKYPHCSPHVASPPLQLQLQAWKVSR
jgi:hypothetical protein